MLIAVLMVMIRKRFIMDRLTFESFVVLSPVVFLAFVAAYLPNKITLGLASLMCLFIAFYLPEAFTTVWMPHVTPEYLRYLQTWDRTADVAQIIATCAGAAGLGFMWASVRGSRNAR